MNRKINRYKNKETQWICISQNKSEYLSLWHSPQDGDDHLLALEVEHAGLAVVTVHEARLYDGAHGEGGGRRGDAGIGVKAFLSVFIHNVRQLLKANLHLTVMYKYKYTYINDF